MLRQLRSKSATANRLIVDQPRTKGEDNLQWLARALDSMKSADATDRTHVMLLGGADTLAFRLRVAQSHLRRDMLPSLWSDSLLISLRGTSLARARAVYVPLLQPDSGEIATRSNGVIEKPLKAFADAQRWPNIALIALPVAPKAVQEKLDAFRQSRATLDALEHVLRWLGFAWGAARTPNPLLDGVGLPSACMLETVFAAASFDLTPGLESRASCPEAIWVAARHWQEYFAEFAGAKPAGRVCAEHLYPIEEYEQAQR